ncbi:MAG: epimerase [Gemmatimonadetes bacterium]|nr:epimerase [Gemmatimonadota bacterium]
MTVVAISGASGFIGGALVRDLTAAGHDVRRFARHGPVRLPGDIAWDPEAGTLDSAALADADVIVHLAGAPVAQRWSAAVKRDIRDSRVHGTQLIAQSLGALARTHPKPRVLLSGSAVGIYGDRGDEWLDEQSPVGSDFLAQVGAEWEGAAQPASDAGVRVAFLRTGFVLHESGGALERMLPPFRLGAGGRLGSGAQFVSWISLHDVLRAIRHLMDHPVRGPVNIVGPAPVTNEEFTSALGHALNRPAVIPVPEFALALAFGEMARNVLLASQRVRATVLHSTGFRFDDDTLEGALQRALR